MPNPAVSRPCRFPRLPHLLGLGLALLVWAPVTLEGQKADTLVMNNGDVITGEIKVLGRGKLSYKTDDMGTLSIKWSKVYRLVTRNYYEVELENGSRYYGTFGWSAEDRKLVVLLTQADTLDMDRVVGINRIQGSFLARTYGYVDLGFNLTRANSQKEWTLGAKANYRGPRWGASIDVSSYFRFQADTASNTSRNTTTVAARRIFPRKWSAVASVALEQNEEINLQLRTTTGGGPSYDFIRSNAMILAGLAGVVATKEKYSTSPDATLSLETVFAVDWEAFQLDSPKLDLQTTLSVFPSLTDLGRVRTQWDFRFSYELLSDFTVGLTGFVTYDSRPPTADAVKADYRTAFTVGWTWS